MRMLSEKAKDFVVISNHIHSSKVTLDHISLVRKPHTKIHPHNTIKLLRAWLVVLYV